MFSLFSRQAYKEVPKCVYCQSQSAATKANLLSQKAVTAATALQTYPLPSAELQQRLRTCHFTGGTQCLAGSHWVYIWMNWMLLFFFATSTFPLPGLLCFQFWRVNSLKTSALLEMFCAFSKPHPHGGYVVTKNRQSCIMQACKQEKVAKRGCWTLGPHRMELYTTWASLTLCTGFCSSLHSQKVSTATATSHHTAHTSEVQSTSEVNFTQQSVMLTSVHLWVVTCSLWYRGQFWNCFQGSYIIRISPPLVLFPSFHTAALQQQRKGSVTVSQEHGKGTNRADPASLMGSTDVLGQKLKYHV